MTPRRVAILAVVALTVVAAAFWLASLRRLPRDTTFSARVLPTLLTNAASVSGIRIIGAGDRTLVTLARSSGRFGVAERGGYPADVGRVRTLVSVLTELKVREPKTSEPSRYAALGVEDLAQASAKGVRVELDGLPAPLGLIVGRMASAGDAVYVRVPGTAQAIEAGPAVTVEREPKAWIQRTLLEVAADRVRELQVTRTDGPTWRAVRQHAGDQHLIVPDLPKGKALSSPGAVDPVAGVLARLDADDVRAAATASAPAAVQRAVFHTFDGLTLEFAGWSEGEDRWVTIAATADPASDKALDRGRSDAAAIAALTHGWQYRLPSYRYDDLFRARDALLKH